MKVNDGMDVRPGATNSAEVLRREADRLSQRVSELSFGPPVALVYNPLSYARDAHGAYLDRFAAGPKTTLFVGMNPGPWGMAQTGVPFGEVAAVRDWMGIRQPVGRPPEEHPRRPIEGFDCRRSEVSGRRLWGLMRERFGSADAFFARHFVANYCPLLFMEASGRNRTPDKLPRGERDPLFVVCDHYLRLTIEQLQPRCIVAVGGFARARVDAVMAAVGRDLSTVSSGGRDLPQVVTILHPSPANPRANRGWSEEVTAQLAAAGVWP